MAQNINRKLYQAVSCCAAFKKCQNLLGSYYGQSILFTVLHGFLYLVVHKPAM